jgi:hypothetical protein
VSEPADLAYLCHHYGEAYEVNMRRRRFEARRRDDGTALTADSADALLDLIRADYACSGRELGYWRWPELFMLPARTR